MLVYLAYNGDIGQCSQDQETYERLLANPHIVGCYIDEGRSEIMLIDVLHRFKMTLMGVETASVAAGTNFNLKDVERETILAALKLTEYSQREAATYLGVSSRVLNYKIQKHGIRHESWRKNS